MSSSSNDRPSGSEKRTDVDPSIDAREVARFEALAAEWWDPAGKFAPLHRLNPARIRFIRNHAAAHFGRDPEQPRPLDRLRLLDIGAGGGLVAEPMARLGARVMGIDPAEKNIGVARVHAREMGLEIDYRAVTAEALLNDGERFDVVLALEVVEHVADLGAFMDAACGLVAPGGAMIATTLNRTFRAFALAIIGAEYVMGWLPRGTHQWSKFVTPDELTSALTERGFGRCEIAGLTYSPLLDEWRNSDDTGVNYMIYAARIT